MQFNLSFLFIENTESKNIIKTFLLSFKDVIIAIMRYFRMWKRNKRTSYNISVYIQFVSIM